MVETIMGEGGIKDYSRLVFERIKKNLQQEKNFINFR